MQDKERETLKANAEHLADLLTENVPYLIAHYLQNGVINEAEREDIIQADSAQEIKMKLVKTLAAKEGISLEAVIDGLDATENQSVSNEIKNLLSDHKSEEVTANGSGDNTEDLSTFATNLVDEVIAKAEKTTAEQAEVDEENAEDTSVAQAEVVSNSVGHDDRAVEKLIETSAEVHSSQDEAQEEEQAEDDWNTSQQEVENSANENEDDVSLDVPDKNVNFAETVATIIDDGKHDDGDQEEVPESPTTPFRNNGSDAQQESENEDIDNIDIEKEFVMPAEAETSVTNNNSSKMVRMESNDIVLDGDQAEDTTNNNEGIEDSELAAVLARKALVKQQVQMFEKNSPTGTGGAVKVKYSIRNAGKEPEPKQEESGSNVKNLKNFFQRLSTTDNATSSPASGPVKPVGKLKVTFPASS